MEKEEKFLEKEKLLEQSEISLLLENYDDIFSDFDSRAYSQKAISQDFLEEAERASRDKEYGKVELRFLVPSKIRNTHNELIIKKRLKNHFKRHSELAKKEFKGVIMQGIFFVILGIIIMFIAAFILFSYSKTSLFSSFLIIFLEPAGWFFFWEGLDLIIFETKKKKPEFEFYRKMSKCKISFSSY